MPNAIRVTAFAPARPVSQQTKVFLTSRFAFLADGSEVGLPVISVMTVNDVVNTIETSEKWRTNLLIGNSEINFKIDTGADVTVILS